MTPAPQPHAKDLKAIEDYIYSSMNHTEEWRAAEQAYQNILAARSRPAPAPEALKDCHNCTCPCTHVGKDLPFEIPCPEFRGLNSPKVGEITIRKSVMNFALLMEIKLRKNDHKSHWSGESFTYLFGRLDDERKELDREVSRQSGNYERIIDEAIDEADFLMMIVDNLQSLRTEAHK